MVVGSLSGQNYFSRFAALLSLLSQDTCTGFLLGGVGELNNKRQPNFLVVDKGQQAWGGGGYSVEPLSRLSGYSVEPLSRHGDIQWNPSLLDPLN